MNTNNNKTKVILPSFPLIEVYKQATQVRSMFNNLSMSLSAENYRKLEMMKQDYKTLLAYIRDTSLN